MKATHAQRLIDKCGGTFAQECTPDTLVTLRNRFIGGRDVYRFKKGTLVGRLDIKMEEQEQLEILRELPKQDEEGVGCSAGAEKESPRICIIGSLKSEILSR